MDIILASASPRRKELLEHAGLSFIVTPSAAEEIVPEGYPLEKAPELLAQLKAKDVAASAPDALVIGADTGVFIDGQMLGKPKDPTDAAQMLRTLSGRTHKVITGCHICCGEKERSFTEITEVTFFELSEQEIEAYVHTSEPYDKAGGYAIQGSGMLWVEKINGDYCNVVGLPVARLLKIIDTFR